MVTNINVDINKRSDFYSKYAKDRLRSDLVDFILEECNGENYKNRININIYSTIKLSDDEKNFMMDTIRRTYGLRVQDMMYYNEKSKNKKTILLLFGIVLIILYYCSVVSILREIILILGWLAIWESVYGLIFDTHRDFVRVTRLRALSKARVYFYSKDDSKS